MVFVSFRLATLYIVSLTLYVSPYTIPRKIFLSRNLLCFKIFISNAFQSTYLVIHAFKDADANLSIYFCLPTSREFSTWTASSRIAESLFCKLERQLTVSPRRTSKFLHTSKWIKCIVRSASCYCFMRNVNGCAWAAHCLHFKLERAILYNLLIWKLEYSLSQMNGVEWK